MNQLEKCRSASGVAAELGVTPRHIRRLRAEFRETGSAHVPRLPGRPALPPSQEAQLVLDAYKLEEVGVLRTAISLHGAAVPGLAGLLASLHPFRHGQQRLGRVLLSLLYPRCLGHGCLGDMEGSISFGLSPVFAL